MRVEYIIFFLFSNVQERALKNREPEKRSERWREMPLLVLCNIGRCSGGTIRPQGHFGQNLHNEITYNCLDPKVPTEIRIFIIARPEAFPHEIWRFHCSLGV